MNGGRRRLSESMTTLAYSITITQDLSIDATPPAILVPTAATLNTALVKGGNGNVVVTTEPVQEEVTLILSLTITTSGSSCLEGNEGTLCAVCAADYYRPSAFLPCKPCGNEALSMLSAAGALVAMVVLLIVFIHVNRRAPSGLIRPFINLVQQLTVMLVRFDAQQRAPVFSATSN